MRDDYFWTRVDKRGEDECWPWLGTAHPKSGRGIYGGTTAPRRAWELHHGQEMPKGINACHSCDNPPCCNPGHIWPGTQAQNLADARAKGRMTGPKRKPFCKQGHAFSEENTRVDSKGRRFCRACNRERVAKHLKRERAVLRKRGLSTRGRRLGTEWKIRLNLPL